jgi:ABC-2 type transport system permease protein
MSSEGAIFDLDYRRYEGTRTGRNKIRWAIVRDGVRKVLGFRRKARRKIVPWLLIAAALLPAIVNVGVQVLSQGFGAEELVSELLISHSDYFGITFVIMSLFVAFAVPELVIPDREHGVLTVYASRPLTLVDYLVSRVAALLLLVATFTFIPQIILYLGGAVLSGDIFDYVKDNIELLWQVPLGAVAVFATQAGVAFIISAMARKKGVATGIYIAWFLIAGGVAFGLAEAVNRWFALIDLQGSAIMLVSRIFDDPSIAADTTLGENGISAWASLMVVIAIAAFASGLMYRRYRKLM